MKCRYPLSPSFAQQTFIVVLLRAGLCARYQRSKGLQKESLPSLGLKWDEQRMHFKTREEIRQGRGNQVTR